jgi:hypothetical protein
VNWEISQLSVDYKQSRAMVSLFKQGPPTAPNDNMSISVNFAVADADQQREGAAEAALKARTKQILIEAANSL